MRVSEFQLRDPFEFCETLGGQKVHLYVPTIYHSLTLCRKVVYEKGFKGNPNDRLLCNTCWHGRRKGARP